MKSLLAILVLFVHASQAPDKWSCREGSEIPRDDQLLRVKLKELKDRIISCETPRLPGTFDGHGKVAVEVQIDEEGDVKCARSLSRGHPLLKHAAVKAAKQWRFKPLNIDGRARPYIGMLVLLVSWDTDKSDAQCPKEKRRA